MFCVYLSSVKQVDFFDDGIMEKLKTELTFMTDLTQIDLNGSSNSATFHSYVSTKESL